MRHRRAIFAFGLAAALVSFHGCGGKIRYPSYYVLNRPAPPPAADPPKPVLGSVAVRESIEVSLSARLINLHTSERALQETDDAYVRADLTPLSPMVAGRVATVAVWRRAPMYRNGARPMPDAGSCCIALSASAGRQDE
jgi:hypothetical protein